MWFFVGCFYCIIGLPICETATNWSSWLEKHVNREGSDVLLVAVWLTWPISLTVILTAEWVGRLRK